MNPNVDWYFSKNENWEKEINKLRTIILACGLTEELKWGSPCYTYEGSNIVLIHVFKEYCAVLFFKGALLKDDNRILIQQSENVQSARQVRFTNSNEIVKLEKTVKAYIYEAIEIEKAGLKVKLKKVADYNMPEEFQKKLAKNKSLKAAFEKLTPGRQRGYLLHFSSAKQAKTREARVEKYLQKILDGKGLDD
ncbi:YdeI/OmpD-associated family protein [Lacibacter sp.]|uniref:YdeI/OmpD-associated family protein n=1 Tax=Lacibacter sp. TaxID=1915409 RepID=UPI002B4B6F25|nr:YdeI/OmpD-associated family protein [Lacibacter sp.]HLP39371.1 YdeI/OmpD-associated family protein [Lacibacter sp.]